jgi:uncharacterized protein (DUF488 family)
MARETAPPFAFFTVGHSTRSLEEFARLLRAADVRLVADVRTVPKSRKNPQFNRETLPDSLVALGIGYQHLAALGGLRGRAAGVPEALNGFWKHPSFRNYADYALSEGFREGLERLIALGRERRLAVMCSEAVWWRCHRRIVADHLIARGETVFHLMGEDRIEPARITPAAVVGQDRMVTYPG